MDKSKLINRNRNHSAGSRTGWSARKRRAQVIADDWKKQIDWTKTSSEDLAKGTATLKTGKLLNLSDLHPDIRNLLR